jgi:hypothetical protein
MARESIASRRPQKARRCDWTTKSGSAEQRARCLAEHETLLAGVEESRLLDALDRALVAHVDARVVAEELDDLIGEFTAEGRSRGETPEPCPKGLREDAALALERRGRIAPRVFPQRAGSASAGMDRREIDADR